MRILKVRDVISMTGLSRATISRAEEAGRFPRHVLLTNKRIGWFEDEIIAWMESLRHKRDQDITRQQETNKEL